MDDFGHFVKHMIDVSLAVVTVVGTFANSLPIWAALISMIWTIMRIIEMWTGKSISEMRKK